MTILRLFIIALITSSQLVFSQSFPVHKIDSSFYADSCSLVIRDQINDYEEYIVYSKYGFWLQGPHFYFLGSKDGTWQAYRFIIHNKTSVFRTHNVYKIRREKIQIQPAQVNEMLGFLTAQSFWELQSDSLCQTERKINDSITEMVSDGCTDQFFIYSNGKYYDMQVYMVDFYQGLIPNQQKATFIHSRNKLLAIIHYR